MNISSHQGETPIPITSTFLLGGGAHCQSQINCIGPHPPPLPDTRTPLALPTPDNSKKGVIVRYRECLKNHAASIGGNATDGCGEFMPSGKEGTLEALMCSACHCHRNFHRKETEGISSSSCDCFQFKGGRKIIEGYFTCTRPSPHQMIMPLGAIQTSESDEMEGYMTRTPIVKKRFRTKFSVEQKEMMLGFAEKVGWRLQKQEESLVQQFCQEIGIKRRVLKVWMHNNKHNLAKKSRNLQLDWSISTTAVTDL